ncbi:MAG: 3-hydroxyacyl-CoA dehydrogenase [Gammaproteobacteria bacterium]|nr:3-hydroxyacyl-CoA dehydrogenase [Gammaproteobacteria bacterium]
MRRLIGSINDTMSTVLEQATSRRYPVAIVGAGSIGTAFAVVHALAGRDVRLYDVAAEALDNARSRLDQILADLAHFGLLEEAPAEVAARVQTSSDLAEALAGVAVIHECAPENLEIKQAVTIEIDRLAPPHAAIASASSAIPASEYARAVAGRSRCLVAHPGNPPYLLRVVEIVPAPFTDASVVRLVESFLEAAGLACVIVRRELRGFVFNRLQGALLREAYCLVRDGVASVEEIDAIVRGGLGLRWSVVGPFETVDLNTRGGIERHASILGPAYAAMGAERGQFDPWTDELIGSVTAQRRAQLPLERWEERVRWRDRELMRLLAARRSFSDSEC